MLDTTPITVSAAASLTDAFTEIGRAFARATPHTAPPRFNFGASGALLQQILNGAPVDVFASAGEKEMDTLARAGRLVSATRIDFTTNAIVLVAPAGVRLSDWRELTGTRIRRVALSDPESVPSGRYARETLTRRGLWASLQSKLVLGENVRQTLAYVAHGDVDAGVVFLTDAKIEPRRVRVVARATPGRDHDPIRYPAAVVAGTAQGDAARAFVRFLRSGAARRVLHKYGFG